jgi:hypothetical protein
MVQFCKRNVFDPTSQIERDPSVLGSSKDCERFPSSTGSA